MHTRTEKLQDNDVIFSSAGCHSSIKTFGFRTALVIEESENLRRSLVEHLKKRGWIVHGVRRLEQAIPVLGHIPYHLVLFGCEISGMTGVEFAKVICESDKGQGVHLVALTGSRSRFSAEELVNCGAFVAEKSVWRRDLSSYLNSIENAEQVLERSALCRG
jgi:DNA-binding response OmpR family regulator